MCSGLLNSSALTEILEAEPTHVEIFACESPAFKLAYDPLGSICIPDRKVLVGLSDFCEGLCSIGCTERMEEMWLWVNEL